MLTPKLTSEERMALWATINAVRHAEGLPAFDYGHIRYWWARFESELEMERAFRRNPEAFD